MSFSSLKIEKNDMYIGEKKNNSEMSKRLAVYSIIGVCSLFSIIGLCFLFSLIMYPQSTDNLEAQISILNEDCNVIKSANCTGSTKCWDLVHKYNYDHAAYYVPVHIYQPQLPIDFHSLFPNIKSLPTTKSSKNVNYIAVVLSMNSSCYGIQQKLCKTIQECFEIIYNYQSEGYAAVTVFDPIKEK